MRSAITAAVVIVTGIFAAPAAHAQDGASLAGRWTLNRAASQIGGNVGFDAPFPVRVPGDNADGPSGGRRGRRGSATGGARGAMPWPESEDDAKRLRLLTDEVREPADSVTITQTAAAVTFADDRGRSRTVHPHGREEEIDLGGVAVVAIARWEGPRLVVIYEVQHGRQLQYTYSRPAGPDHLAIDIAFIERGRGDTRTLVYEPAADSVTPAAPSRAAASPPAAPGPSPASAGQPTPFTARPGSEFKGLTDLDVVIEDLSSESIRCGLVQSDLDKAVSQHLAGAGLRVHHNSSEDTYVYVNIKTAMMAGTCVSRYDVSLTTHTTATLTYQPTPVLVEVTLFHRGSIAGGAPGTLAAAVQPGVLAYVDQIAAQVRDANK